MRDSKIVWLVLAALVVVALIVLSSGPSSPSNTQTSVVPSPKDAVLDKPAQSGQTSTQQESNTTSQGATASREVFTYNNTEYALEKYGTDQRIVKTVGKQRTVLVPSVKSAIPELGNLSLSIFVVKQNPFLVAFVSAPAAGGPYGNLYRFDVNTSRFIKLFVSRFLPLSRLAADDPAWLPADHTKFLSLRDRAQPLSNEAMSLFLVDVVVDQARSVVAVSGGESLTKTLGSGGDPQGEYRWLGMTSTGVTQLEYAVFSTNTLMPRSSIGVRTVNINLDQK